jgi:exodeoxyribonuclease-3
MQWEDDFRAYMMRLNETKPVIVCGDLNVAHEEIDLKNPKTNRNNAGFTDEEREKMTTLLGSGFIDTFRTLYPEQVTYSWWSYRFKAREKNTGWRIDYFITSETLKDRIADPNHTEIFARPLPLNCCSNKRRSCHYISSPTTVTTRITFIAHILTNRPYIV